jgi:Hemerythrin HHE cation binding domain/Phasin protein
MDFGEIIKRDHQGAAEILERLEESSEGALKTRERLSRQLARLLGGHAKKEEAHFYSALRRHSDAHEGMDVFLAGAGEAHREIIERARELDAMAKDDERFAGKAGELRAAAQRHMRDEERLLTSLRRALDEEESAALDRAMAGRAEEAAAEAGESALAAPRETHEAAEETAASTRSAVFAAADIFNETAQLSAEDIQVIATCSIITSGGLGEMRQAWLEWLSRNLRAGARASQELMRCTTIEQLAEIQRGFISETLDNLLEGSAQLLRISSRISQDTARPIEERALQLRRVAERTPIRSERGA